MSEFLNQSVQWTNNILWSYIVIIMLLTIGIYFTIRTKFIQIRSIREMVRLLGDGIGQSGKSKNGVSSFQAFCIGMASRVGVGNIAGVAIAISYGGPGAVFWMWLIALIGSALAFVESTLAQIYKIKDKNGFRGGPAYYMEKALGRRWMGILFSILITLSFGLVFNSVQSNTISQAFQSSFGLDKIVTGLLLAVIVAIIIFGGVKRIAKATEAIVPVMALAYVMLAVYVIATNLSVIPDVLVLIFKSAFGLDEGVGGGIGAAISMGIKRGLFSNEAGMGSSPNAAAAADVTHPVKQGLIQTLGAFIDTLLICSSTVFIILVSGVYSNTSLEGIEMTQMALSLEFGPWASIILTVAIFFFGLSAMVGNYYYGETNIGFIRSSKTWLFIYRLAVIGMVIFGAKAELKLVWNMADLFMGLMALVNLTAIWLLSHIAFAALKDYRQQRNQGKEPQFYSDTIPGLTGVECWEPRPGQNRNETPAL
ncbi:alanine/glycine:cation symporter family protein [Paenibacillus larvae]|uniref:Alanine/glycine:cation symporter family protein n=1 Tax=Paenibacillus larvae TaxID=1464 RepID=A0AAP5N0U3_9BACL|nr:alanine/glycine:cation symporter family protein [Paenibacillus larvae]AVF23146.1 putative sodium/glutamine symporter GlnT [Paenibacillus larvae subsp. larvae]ETK26179.1 putative sodium/glutamine symporter GlnT [Paenibacillus larvae subsp. larvae DSM 25719]MCY7488235.1 alanine:cation symporter family protein [Paenibacillus larvae]MCY9563451.1 alanine:cation symporter family protein [Paenibacillus larvae]MCY9567515.1 alanine:cation symporter family protein [Paenibacillus larvae]